MNTPKYIILHHTGVSYNKNADQYEATNRYHKSLGWGMIGYHYEIAKDGTIHSGRKESQVGAHCSQSSMNYQSIGIALDGNFDEELPTSEQMSSLRFLLSDIRTRWNIPDENIKNHREYARKTCPGKRLPNDWFANLIKTVRPDLDGKVLLSVEEKGKLYFYTNGRLDFRLEGESIDSFLARCGVLVGISLNDLDKLI